MRSSLRWILGCTLVLSAASALWPQKQLTVVAPVPRGPSPADSSRVVGSAASAGASLPEELPDWQFEPARRDPFATVLPSAPAEPALHAAPPPPPPAAAAQIAPPAAPPISLRYLGTMLTPEGSRLVMLARGDTPVPVAAGASLEEGYVVQAVGSDAVQLIHPATGTTVAVPIPEAFVQQQ